MATASVITDPISLSEFYSILSDTNECALVFYRTRDNRILPVESIGEDGTISTGDHPESVKYLIDKTPDDSPCFLTDENGVHPVDYLRVGVAESRGNEDNKFVPSLLISADDIETEMIGGITSRLIATTGEYSGNYQYAIAEKLFDN